MWPRPRTMIGWNVAGPLGKGYKKFLTILLWAICIWSTGLCWRFKFMSNHNYMPKGKYDGLGNRGDRAGEWRENLNWAFFSRGACAVCKFVTWEPWCKEISLKDKEKEGKELPVKKSCPAFMLDFIFNKGFHPMYSGSWVVVGEIQLGQDHFLGFISHTVFLLSYKVWLLHSPPVLIGSPFSPHSQDSLTVVS